MAMVSTMVASGATGAGTEPARPLVGAIRWDAWHGDQGVPGQAVQHSLAPERWHWRLPFFAKVVGDDQVSVDGSSQEVMDQEIAYASRAGLDYWAFVTYPPVDPMSLGLQRYLASQQRSQIRFCLVTECGRWQDPAFVERLAALMAEPGYLTVLDGRPVLYLGFITETLVQKCWGSGKAFRAVVDGLRERVRRQGLGKPYLVIMDFDPKRGKKWLRTLGADALSSYATSGGGKQQPYAELARHAEGFWAACQATQAQVVPLVMSGWDRRPRIARPVPWETWQQPGVGLDLYYEAPTPAELATHLTRALEWITANPASAKARLAIVYAWNENDEGGWLVPTLSEGAARLDALGQVLRPPGVRGRPALECGASAPLSGRGSHPAH